MRICPSPHFTAGPRESRHTFPGGETALASLTYLTPGAHVEVFPGGAGPVKACCQNLLFGVLWGVGVVFGFLGGWGGGWKKGCVFVGFRKAEKASF